MATEIINRGRGPEIAGTRITVLNVIPYLEEGFSHEEIQDILGLNQEQFAAALAYLEANRAALMHDHRKVEERLARGNPPEVEEKLAQSGRRLLLFKEWLHKRSKNGDQPPATREAVLREFEEWLETRDASEGIGT